ncbi:hypothetical protein BC937DRAFT_88739 [Endogone sp. FLAS-F59071]|nr:hypothetical protein BC937DRAFT_88739 [Endogone sp. FLAS-F59071]|eukprot:RUS18469.1 hypothetical protein BC937DRAFT_88739 [Endogone sp. FLAS-F59071]
MKVTSENASVPVDTSRQRADNTFCRLESEYERKRRRNISENQQILRELGLTKHGLVTEHKNQPEPIWVSDKSKKKRVYPKVNERPISSTVSRTSRRLKGEAPVAMPSLDDVINEHDQPILDLTPSIAADTPHHDKRALWKGKKQTTGILEAYEVPDHIVMPLTLGSIGTTIWNTGSLITGENRKRYWSGRGCLYKHPYPVGYRATKRHFNQNYTMTISEGVTGPVFTVTAENGQSWHGPTPTAPWTEACKKSHSTGTRVSGPLFFGFSDPITLKLIENLPGYALAADQDC